MKTVPILYIGPMPAVQIEIAQGRTLEAKRGGAAVVVSEAIADELLARGDFINADQHRNGDGDPLNSQH